MAGSITVTLTKKQSVWDGLRGFIECKIDWVTQAAGAGEGTLTSAAIVTTAQYNSYLAGRECIMAGRLRHGRVRRRIDEPVGQCQRTGNSNFRDAQDISDLRGTVGI